MQGTIRDGRGFLPQVLRDPKFRADGLLFGTERRFGMWIHWVVVDPGRHVLHVWRKTSASYLDDAMRLEASVISNGPFADYADGSLKRSTFFLVADFVKAAVARPREAKAVWTDQKARHYGGIAPNGYVLGTTAVVRECTVARPRLHYFGRRAGTSFGDYEIAKGDPGDLAEAIGGLFRVVDDFRPYTISRPMRTGFWGLAPLSASPVLADDDVDAALAAYEAGRPAGLIVGVAGWANTRRLARMLADIGVRDAVQFDGSNSLLFGGDGRLLIGRRMPGRKRLLQAWGFRFVPRKAR